MLTLFPNYVKKTKQFTVQPDKSEVVSQSSHTGPANVPLITDSSFNEAAETDSHVNNLMQKIVKVWGKHSVVRSRGLDFEEQALIFNPEKNDFLESLLPFAEQEAYYQAPESMKKKILSCGWIIYNEKTLAIETEIVTPACNSIINGRIPGLTSSCFREFASETLVDEAYHSYMVTKANAITRKERNLDVQVPLFTLVKELNAYKNSLSLDWEKDLAQMATAIVSEVFISDYLSLLSTDQNIQPLNTATVEAHMKDELVHGYAFKWLTKTLYKSLSPEQQMFFCKILPKPIRWFASKELDIWGNVLQQIGFKEHKSLIEECRLKSDQDLQKINYSPIIKLASESGIFATQIGIKAFEDEGLISNSSISKMGKMRSKL